MITVVAYVLFTLNTATFARAFDAAYCLHRHIQTDRILLLWHHMEMISIQP